MTQQALIERIETGWRSWSALLNEVGPERMSVAVAGEWTVKDIAGHVGWYEWWTAEFIRTRAWPVLPAHLDFEDMDQRNDAYFSANRDRPASEVIAESSERHQGLISALKQVSDAEFADQTLLGMPAEDGWQLIEWVPENSYEHYEQHSLVIRKWLGLGGKAPSV